MVDLYRLTGQGAAGVGALAELTNQATQALAAVDAGYAHRLGEQLKAPASGDKV